MVGYRQSDTLSTNQKLIAGCISGCMTRFITQPLDYLKLKAQVEPSKKKKKKIVLFRQTRKILKHDGVQAFYRGHNLGQFAGSAVWGKAPSFEVSTREPYIIDHQLFSRYNQSIARTINIHSIVSVSTQFYVYELLTKYCAQNYDITEYRTFCNFLCATLAGCASTTLVMPIEVIRVRQMIAENQYRGLRRGAMRVYQTGGILAFYEGLGPAIIQTGPAVGIGITVFRHVQEYILVWLKARDIRKGYKQKNLAPGNESSPEHLVLASTIAGSVSGLASKTLMYPLDLTKKRMQISSHRDETPNREKKLIKCFGILTCMINTIEKEGIAGLFRGWKVTIYKAQLTSIVAFTSYEVVCNIMRDFNIVVEK